MRINLYIAQSTGMSRRAADQVVQAGRVTVNDQLGVAGQQVEQHDRVTLDGELLRLAPDIITIMLHKPRGYVCSRNGQGSKTIYDLLPENLHHLKPVGRLDKASEGLLLLTNDGQLANKLTHPRYQKQKIYHVKLDMSLAPGDEEAIDVGIRLNDGLSRLELRPLNQWRISWEVRMSEGRNRQIRRTFGALHYKVTQLRRIQFGVYRLGTLSPGEHRLVKSAENDNQKH